MPGAGLGIHEYTTVHRLDTAEAQGYVSGRVTYGAFLVR